ncbi:PEP-CTERM sorting domain-containing protein [Oscillatoria sp. HE19RPO]|uniref:PEP-CTERM sorting domain-containing protein n=1 Tax=Oscillatoria sp. HE19RPO TaxID=2954806 RepID=UPI0020C281F0|nr:PEP-CTERM sorting domain-containing protein [Oscillatoria sp. HE19RPO]
MNVQQQILSVAATATLVGIGMASAAPASAITLTTTNYIQGNGSTVEFGWLGSYGGFQSKVGIFDVTRGEYFDLFTETRGSSVGGNATHANKGDLDNATFSQDIQSIKTQFTFLQGHEYSFFLGSANQVNSPTVFSTTSLNQNKPSVEFGQQAKFFSDLSVLNDESYKYIRPVGNSTLTDSTQSLLAQASGTNASLSLGMTGLIAFEDNGIRNPSTGSTQGFHRDFNDFLFTATVIDEVAVPEPATLIGLGMFAGCMALSSRRRKTEDKAS